MEDEQITSGNGGEGNDETQKVERSDKEMFDSFLNKEKIGGSADTNQSKETKTPVDNSKSADSQKDLKKTQGHGKAAERIGELTRKHKTAVSELEKLRKEFEDYRKTEKIPSRAESTNDEEYIAKLTDKQVNERMHNERIKQLESEASTAQTEAWNETIKSQVTNFEDFAKKYNKYSQILSDNDELTTEYVMKSSVGPKMLEELFTKMEDPTFANAWYTMPTAKKNVILYELEKHVSRPMQAQPTVSKTNAPKPIIPGNGAHNNAPKSDKEMLDAFLSKRK